MAIVIVDPCGDATHGFELCTGATNAAVVTGGAPGHAKSYQFVADFGSPSYVTYTPPATINEGALSFRFCVDIFHDSSYETICTTHQTANGWFKVVIRYDGLIEIWDGIDTAIADSGDFKLSVDTWYQIKVQWNYTNGASTQCWVSVDGTQVAGDIFGDLGGTVTSTVRIGCLTGGGSLETMTARFNDFILYDTNTGSYTDALVTCKLPNANNVNEFDTLVGSGTNRYDRISERPLSVSNGIAQRDATENNDENFGIQSASTGDVDLTGATLVGYQGWVYGKLGVAANGVPTANAVTNKATATYVQCSMTTSAGDFLIVAFADVMGGATPTITDPVGHTWTQLNGPTTNGVRLTKWWTRLTASIGWARVEFSSSNAAKSMMILRWVGDNFDGSGSPIDIQTSDANDSASPYDCPASGTLSQANEVVVGIVAANGNEAFAAGSGTTLPSPGTWTAHTTGGGATSNVSLSAGYKVVSSTASANCNFTLGTNRNGVVATITLKYTPKYGADNALIHVNGSTVQVAMTPVATSVFKTTSFTSSASYPSSSAAIGLAQVASSNRDLELHECGILIVYRPSTGNATATGATVSGTASAIAGSATAASASTGVTVTATASAIAGSPGASHASPAATVTGTVSAIPGAATAASSSPAATVTGTASAIAGGYTRTASVDGAVVSGTASALPGTASGSTNATANGATVTGTASAIAAAPTAASTAAGVTTSATASPIAGTPSASNASAGTTLTATASAVTGQATASSQTTAVTLTATASPIAGSPSSNSQTTAVTLTATASAIPGSATGAASASATGATVTATASPVAGEATASSIAASATVSGTASAIAGSPTASYTATGVTLTGTASPIAGTATAGITAAGAMVTGTVSALAGSPTASSQTTAVTLTATITPLAGAPTASSSSPAATVVGTASAVPGSATGGNSASATGATVAGTSTGLGGPVTAASVAPSALATGTASPIAGVGSASSDSAGATLTGTATALAGSAAASSQTVGQTQTGVAYAIGGAAGEAQYMRPSGLVSSGGWSAVNAPSIPEALDDNGSSDWAVSPDNPTTEQFEVNLSSVTDPSISSGHTLRVALEAEGQDTAFDMEIRQGATLLDSWSETVSVAQGYVVRPRLLSGVVVDAITNYGDVRFRGVARAP